MKFTKIIISAAVIAASVFSVQPAAAQEFKWGLDFDVKFDDREYDEVKRAGIIRSSTLFSARLTPVVGIGFEGGHNVMLGGNFAFDMGAPLSKRDPELLLYYNYHSPKYKAVAGMFPRTKLIGAYSRAIYAGSHTFYDNVLDGFALQYTPRDGYLELVLDWDGMQSPTVRESFRVMSAGGINKSLFTAGYSFDVYHLASSSDAVEGVVDHILANPWAGVSFEKLWPWFEKLSLKLGWLGSFDRERRGDNIWRTPMGGTIDFTVQKWRVGIRNQTYLGDRQMPFWETYGSRIYKGDQFFYVSGIYSFTQVYWRPEVAKGVMLDVNMGIHFDGTAVGWQPVAWVGVSLDSDMFRNKNRKKCER